MDPDDIWYTCTAVSCAAAFQDIRQFMAHTKKEHVHEATASVKQALILAGSDLLPTIWLTRCREIRVRGPNEPESEFGHPAPETEPYDTDTATVEDPEPDVTCEGSIGSILPIIKEDHDMKHVTVTEERRRAGRPRKSEITQTIYVHDPAPTKVEEVRRSGRPRIRKSENTQPVHDNDHDPPKVEQEDNRGRRAGRPRRSEVTQPQPLLPKFEVTKIEDIEHEVTKIEVTEIDDTDPEEDEPIITFASVECIMGTDDDPDDLHQGQGMNHLDEVPPVHKATGTAPLPESGPASAGIPAPLECTACSQTFPTEAHLKKHAKLAHPKSTNCTICQINFTSAVLLKIHISKIHPSLRASICKKCGQSFPNTTTLTEHRALAHGVECTDCHLKFKLPSLLRLHRKNMHQKAASCRICKESFPSAAIREKHMALLHSNECTVCRKVFKNHSALKLHLSRHMAEKPSECGICLEKFTYRAQLRAHTLTVHSECHICRKKFTQSYLLKGHMQRHANGHIHASNQYECTVEGCGQTFPARGQLVGHLKTVHGQEAAVWQCATCAKKFASSWSLDVHQKIHKFRCDICDQRLQTEYSLARHKTRHVAGDFSCPICHLPFTDGLLFDQHKRSHPYECTACNEEYESGWNLDVHMKSHLPSTADQRNYACFICTPTTTFEANDRVNFCKHIRLVHPNTCVVCQESFASGVDHGTHMKGHGREFKCDAPACGAVFPSSAALRKHSAAHPPTCPICGQSFTDNYKLKKHVKRHWFPCRHCSKSFKSSAYLVIHEARHLEENRRVYTCEVCEKPFSVHEEFRQHMRTVHTQCKICLEEFDAYHQLKNHMRVHAEDRPFKCTKCTQTFKSDWMSRRHMREIHCVCVHCGDELKSHALLKVHVKKAHADLVKQNTQQKVACTVCGMELSNSDRLKKHMEFHAKHPNGLECVICKEAFPNVKELRAHIVDHSECPVCGKVYTRLEKLKRHVLSHANGSGQGQRHSGGTVKKLKEFPCTVTACPEVFSSFREMKAHVNASHTECPVCQKKFNSGYKLKAHLVTHSTERPYVCNICGYSSKRADPVSLHVKRAHWDGISEEQLKEMMKQAMAVAVTVAPSPSPILIEADEDEEADEPVPIPAKRSKIGCRFCPEIFTRPGLCLRHELQEHGDLVLKEDSEGSYVVYKKEDNQEALTQMEVPGNTGAVRVGDD